LFTHLVTLSLVKSGFLNHTPLYHFTL